MEEVSEEERDLASKLRRLCTIYGEERRKNLAQTAEVLRDMGELYITKAEQAGGMLQKLSFLRASALLNGAKVRYKKTKMLKKRLSVDKMLHRLHISVLSASHAANDKINLLAVSSVVLKRVQKLRASMMNKLNVMENIPEDLSDADQFAAEGAKIKEIQDLTDETTGQYMKIMQDIASVCHAAMGKEPCSFALVGLGSLARREITLFSDFEHVITLADGVEEDTNYPAVKEYFRWFSVIFQLIFIGLGETFIRSVGIKSINDLYAGSKDTNWFFDIYTPCGIAFDGMVPHSCNNPLGRVEPTPAKPRPLELIQPARTMARYVTMEEHFKNGYYVREVLSCTCLVYGSEDVYNTFLEASRKIINGENFSADVSCFAQHLFRSQPLKVLDVAMSKATNAKAGIYRPVTANLARLARVYKVFSTATFDIVSELHRLSVFDDATTHQLEFAVAVACEIRMKVYHETGHQRHRLRRKNIVDIVGKTSAIRCLCYAKCLESATHQLFVLNKTLHPQLHLFEEEYKKRIVMGMAEAYQFLGCLDDAQRIGEEYVRRDDADRLQRVRLARIYELQAQEKPDQKEEYLHKAADTLHTAIEMVDEPTEKVGLFSQYEYIRAKLQPENDDGGKILEMAVSAVRPERSNEGGNVFGDQMSKRMMSSLAQGCGLSETAAMISAGSNDASTMAMALLSKSHIEILLLMQHAGRRILDGDLADGRQSMSTVRQKLLSKHNKLLSMEIGLNMLVIELKKGLAEDALLTLDFYLDANEGNSMPEYKDELEKFVDVKVALLFYIMRTRTATDERLALIQQVLEVCECEWDSDSGREHRTTLQPDRSKLAKYAKRLVVELWRLLHTDGEEITWNKRKAIFILLRVVLVSMAGDTDAKVPGECTEEKRHQHTRDILNENEWIHSLNDLFINRTESNPVHM